MNTKIVDSDQQLKYVIRVERTEDYEEMIAVEY